MQPTTPSPSLLNPFNFIPTPTATQLGFTIVVGLTTAYLIYRLCIAKKVTSSSVPPLDSRASKLSPSTLVPTCEEKTEKAAPAVWKDRILQETLQEMNQTTFSPKGIQVKLLTDCPGVIPVLAEWIYNDWHSYSASLTKEIMVESYTSHLNDNKLPFTIVAFREATPIGVVSLENKSEPELEDLEDGDPWGGTLHVEPAERKKGLGKDLATAIVNIAQKAGFKKISFYTSNPVNVNWYVGRGAEVIGSRPFNNHTITIMRYPLLSC